MWGYPVLLFARVPGLIFLFFFGFLGNALSYIMIFWFLLVPGWGFGVSLLFFVSLRNGATNEFFIARERRGNMVCCCLGSMLG